MYFFDKGVAVYADGRNICRVGRAFRFEYRISGTDPSDIFCMADG